MAVDSVKNSNNNIVPPPTLILEYSDDEMTKVHASAELTVFIQLFGRKLGSFSSALIFMASLNSTIVLKYVNMVIAGKS
uniref:Putative ovule protein n=1 Tax=Solanum chacoense TaxID=4108 RepID=A0A0V0I9U0_SOLCH